MQAGLARRGFSCSVVPHNEKIIGQTIEQPPDLVLLDIIESMDDSEALSLSHRIRAEVNIPVVGLIPKEMLDNLDSKLSMDDFIVKPWNLGEAVARIKRILRQRNGLDSKELIECGDLVIDLTKYEVSVGGKPIILTFKEFQLLEFLARNKGRVFTREALLDKVWGWDYYGGDRTVDVHIRRLRSKIEDPTHTFIETVRNIGYRLRGNL